MCLETRSQRQNLRCDGRGTRTYTVKQGVPIENGQMILAPNGVRYQVWDPELARQLKAAGVDAAYANPAAAKNEYALARDKVVRDRAIAAGKPVPQPTGHRNLDVLGNRPGRQRSSPRYGCCPGPRQSATRCGHWNRQHDPAAQQRDRLGRPRSSKDVGRRRRRDCDPDAKNGGERVESRAVQRRQPDRKQQ